MKSHQILNSCTSLLVIDLTVSDKYGHYLLVEAKTQLGLGMPLFLPSFVVVVFAVSNHNSWVLASTIA